MRKLFSIIAFIFILTTVNSAHAQTYVNDPANCPVTFSSQICAVSGQVMCGFDSNILFCIDSNSIVAPSVTATSTTNVSSSFDGGYIIDCESYDGSAPFCDNSGSYQCDRNETNQNTLIRQTVCTANVFGASTAGDCRTGFFDCFGGDEICESTAASACSAGGANNHYTTATCSVASGENPSSATCVCNTNTLACDGVTNDADGCEIVVGATCGGNNTGTFESSCSGDTDGVCTSTVRLNCDGTTSSVCDESGDPNGCEILEGGSCGSSTGTYQANVCQNNTGNCISNNTLDCNNDDGDGNIQTCNGGNGCEITEGASCGNSTGTYQADTCNGTAGNCTSATNIDCDNDDADATISTCNGANGCEITIGGTCTTGDGLSGVYASSCSSGAGVCSPNASNFVTGTESGFSTTDPLLWGIQYGTGLLVDITNSVTGFSFVVDNSDNVGIGIGSSESPASALDVDSNAANTTPILTVENTAGDVQVFRTDATPEGAVTGSIGDIAVDSTNGKIYLKASGSASTTGWSEIGSSASTNSVSSTVAAKSVSTWTARTAADVNSWRSITWSPELGLFAAVSTDGTNRVLTSPDGIAWTGRTAAEANSWFDITWSPELGLFAAVSTGGTNRVMTSPDGITWTARAAAEANTWYSVTWSPELNLFAAVSTGGTNRIMTSPDGITWTARAAAEANQWYSVTWSPELNLFAAVSFDGTNRIMTSPDGITWTARAAAEANQWRSVTWSPELGLFAAVSGTGTNRVMTSTDGITWTARAAAEANTWNSVTWSPELGLFAAVSLGGTNQIMTSPDGINWTGRTAAEANLWWDVEWSPELGLFAGVSAFGTNRVMTSTPPVSYSHVSTLVAGDGQFTSDLTVLDNVFVGATTETLSNTGFTQDGDDAFISGTIGVEGNIYTDGSLVSGASLTLNDSGITDSNSDLSFTSTTDGFSFVFTDGTAGDDFIVDTDTLVVESDNDRVGIGTTTPTEKLTISGGNFLQNPTNPVILGGITDSTNLNNPRGVYVSGDYAYVVSQGDDSLQIIDITNPTSPSIVGEVDDGTNLNGAFDVYVVGKYAYVAAKDDASLRIIDISDPTSPVIVGGVKSSTDLNGVLQVHVSGKYAYVTAATDDSLRIIDISDPTSPVIVGGVKDGAILTDISGLYVSGDYAYVTEPGDDSLHVIDISDPTSPAIVGSLQDNTNLDRADGIHVVGRYAYVTAETSNALQIIDISDPTSPSIVGGVQDASLGGAIGVFVSGNYAYVTTFADDSFRIIDISNPASPVIVGGIQSVADFQNAFGVFVSGKHAYVTARNVHTFRIVDITGIDSPSASIGNIKAGHLSVTDNVIIANDLYSSGLNVGVHGIKSDGDVSFGNNTIVTRSGNVGIGLIGPISPFHVDSNAVNTTPILTVENTAGNIQLFRTDATPEGAITGSIGDIAVDSTNGKIYLKETGSASTTGWSEIGSASAASDTVAGIVELTTTSEVDTGTDTTRAITPAALKASALQTKVDGIAANAIANIVEDTTPQLGAQLDVNTFGLGDGTLELLNFIETSLAVNELTITNAATGNGPSLTATGDDTNIDLVLDGKGTGVVQITNSDFTVNTNTFVVESDNNRVGIGTTPSSSLHADSNAANTTPILTVENTAGNIQVFRTDATPAGAVTGSIGDIAVDSTNGKIYLKEIGSATNTGWTEIGSTITSLASTVGIESVSTWTARTAAQANSWELITWSPELGLFAAVSASGSVMTSPDGITWTARAAAEANGWTSVTWSPELGLFAAVSNAGTNRVMTSPDGITWTARSAAQANSWNSVAWSPELGLFAALSSDGTNRVMTSTPPVSYSHVSTLVIGEVSGNLLQTPSDPSIVGGVDTNDGDLNGAEHVYVSGKYAYVTSLNDDSLRIIDISDPTAPVIVGGIKNDTDFLNLSSVYVSGKYAYVTAFFDSSLRIIDISDPTAPVDAGGIKNTSQLAGPRDVYVSGKYAYVISDGGFRIIDISDPTSLSIVGGFSDSTNLGIALSVYVSGKYAYVTSLNTDGFRIIDVSDSLTPSIVGGIQDSSSLNGAAYAHVSGKYAYVVNFDDDSLRILDISGIDAPSASIGNIEAGNLSVTDNVIVANDLYSTGLNVGIHGIKSDGDVSFADNTLVTSSDNVGIGTSSPGENLEIEVTDTSDPAMIFDSDGNEFTIGIDSGDSDSFKISDSTALGTNDRVILDSSGNLYLSSTVTTTLSNSGFSPSGDDFFVAGSAGIEDSVYTDGSFVSGASLTLSDSGITDSNSDLAFTSTTDGFTFAFTDGGAGDDFIVDTDTFVVESDNNRVGIGTISPSSQLEISATSGQEPMLHITTSAGDVSQRIFGAGGESYFEIQNDDTTASNAWKIGLNDANRLDFNYGTAGSMNSSIQAMSIDTSGNVGIGLDPVSNFHVYQNDAETGDTNAPGATIEQDGTGDAILHYLLTDVTRWVTGVDNSDDDAFKIASALANFNSAPALNIETNGNVGIGTTAPTEKLTMVGGNFLQTSTTPIRAGSLLDSTNMDNAFAVRVSGNYAYVVGSDSDSLAVVDISNPSSPTLAGSLIDSTNMNGANDIYVSGNYAYVVGSDSDSLAVVDISNPSTPTLAGSLIDSTNMNLATDVYVSGKYAYVSGSLSHSLAVVDISNPSTPTLAGSLIDSTNMNRASAVYVSGNYAYVAGEVSDSLAVVDISNPSTPTLAGSLIDSTNMDSARDVYVSGNYAYVAGFGSDSLTIVDISDPSTPTFVDSLINSTTMDGAANVYVSGKYAYLGAGNALTIVDISDPSTLTITGSLIDTTNMNTPYGIHVSGKYAYVASRSSDSLTIVDISGIDAPSASIGNIEAGNLLVTDNVIVANDLYSAGLNVGPHGIYSGGDVGVVGDFTMTPTIPVEVSTIVDGAVNAELSGAAGVYVSGKYAYVTANQGNALSIIDVSNPASPVEVGTIVDGAANTALNGAFGVYVSGKYAYVAAQSDNALSIIDVSNPASPVGVGNIVDGAGATTLKGASDVYVSGNYAYVTSISDHALSIIDVSNPASPVEVGTIVDGVGATNLSAAFGVYVSGNYAYVASISDNALSIIDISGIDAPAASIGNLEAGYLSVVNNAVVANDLYSAGLNVGIHGIKSDGPASFGNGVDVIGTGSQEPILYVTAAVDVSHRMYGAGGESYFEIQNDDTTASNAWKIGLNDANRLDFNYGTAGSMNSSIQAMSINTSGQVGIGDTSPDEELKVVGGICAADAAGDTCSTASGSIDADGTINANNFDLAEKFLTNDETLVAGEIVTFDIDNPTTHIVRATDSDVSVLGVISTKPSLVMGYAVNPDDFDETKVRPVALVGRVPVNVNDENGSIAVGDRLMLSSVPGEAAVYVPHSGIAQTIGIALEGYDGTNTSTITMFIDNDVFSQELAKQYKLQQQKIELLTELVCLDHPDSELCDDFGDNT